MGEKNPNFGKKQTQEQVKHMSKKMKCSNNPSYGKNLHMKKNKKD